MSHFPVFLNLEGRRCVVIGGGKVAERKVLSLLEAGASVTVISPELTEVLQDLSSRGVIEHLPRGYREGDLKGACIAIAATPDAGLNRRVSEENPGVPLNVVDSPELCSFIVPSVVRRGLLSIAVSTSGASPALSRSIREELEELYPEDLGGFLDELARTRRALTASGLAGDRRRRILKRLGSREVLEVVREGGLEAGRRYIRGLLQEEGLPPDGLETPPPAR